MPNYRLLAPAIRWGTNLANAIYFPFPADSVFSGSEPRAGSEFTQGPSGVEAASRVGTDYVWAGTQRWIAQGDVVGPYARCTGWDGALGIRAALEQLQNRNTFSWHPDGRNLLRLPLLNGAGAVTLGGVGGWATNQSGTPAGVSITYDGANNAWKLLATGAAGASLIEIYQRFPAIPGETMCLSVDYKVSGLLGGATGEIYVFALDSGATFLQTHASALALTSAAFVRATTGAGVAVTPASTAMIGANLRLNLPNGASGTIWFKNAMIRRDSTDATFIDNPSVDGCYLVDPTQFSPANESDGSRQLVLRIRNPTTPFDGY